MKKIKNFIKRRHDELVWRRVLKRLKSESRKKTEPLVKIFGFNIQYVEPISLYLELKDIFRNKIYHFSTNKKNPFIIDCGSYIGASILYFKSVYSDAEIIGFEPDPDIFKVLKNNVKVNKLQKIRLINAGLSLRAGVMKFFPDGRDGGSFYQVNKASKRGAVKVPVKKLSAYITKAVDLLKMNIEGAEYNVISEIENKLHLINEIVIEYHCFDELNQNLHEILTILNKNGFRYLVTDATNAKIKTPFILKKGYRYFNIIYAKKWESKRGR